MEKYFLKEKLFTAKDFAPSSMFDEIVAFQ
jgi:hypothetical protein